MSEGNRPAGRLKYRAKDGTVYDVGTYWDNGRGLSLSPQKTNEAHERWPKMKLSEASKRVEAGDGYLNVYLEDRKREEPRRREEPRGNRRQREPEPDFDDDLPF